MWVCSFSNLQFMFMFVEVISCLPPFSRDVCTQRQGLPVLVLSRVVSFVEFVCQQSMVQLEVQFSAESVRSAEFSF